jgi:hypothetical protein
MRYHIKIEIPDECPEGTAMLFILAELIKDVPRIVDQKTTKVIADMDDGDVLAVVTRR